MKYARPTTLSRQGAEFIGRFEGLRLDPYNDPVGYATIGYGHLLHRSNVTDADRRKWHLFTRENALELLQHDAREASAAVRKHVTAKINQAQHDALVSFVFNVGVGAFQTSTLLHVLNRYPGTRWGIVGPRAKRDIRAELLKWDRGGGHVLAGLQARREAEARLFATGRYT